MVTIATRLKETAMQFGNLLSQYGQADPTICIPPFLPKTV